MCRDRPSAAAASSKLFELTGYCAGHLRRWAVLAILTYRKYVPVAMLRPPRSLIPLATPLRRGVKAGAVFCLFMFSIQTGADRFCARRQAWLNSANRCVVARGGGSRRDDALAFGFAAH